MQWPVPEASGKPFAPTSAERRWGEGASFEKPSLRPLSPEYGGEGSTFRTNSQGGQREGCVKMGTNRAAKPEEGPASALHKTAPARVPTLAGRARLSTNQANSALAYSTRVRMRVLATGGPW